MIKAKNGPERQKWENFEKFFRKSLQIQKKVVPLQSRSEHERVFNRKFFEKTERKVQASTEKVQETRASILKGIVERRDQARIISVYTKKSLILAQDER